MTRLLHALPARLLAPLILAFLALAAIVINHVVKTHEYRDEVERQELQYLRELLNREQAQLEPQLSYGNNLQVRRLISGLSLHEGISHAWIVDDKGQIMASLSRLELGKPLKVVLAKQSKFLRQAVLDILSIQESAIKINRIPNEDSLLAHLSLYPKYHLLVSLELTETLAARLFAVSGELWRQALMTLLFAVILAVLLHVLWFRRATQLTAAVTAIGSGQLDVRTNLTGADELASIGAAIDRMAAELQQRQFQLQRLANLIEHSPILAIVWGNAPGWPISFISDNNSLSNFNSNGLRSGTLKYLDIIHPDDQRQFELEIAAHLTSGPDAFCQEYRLLSIQNNWLWIEAQMYLIRQADGTVNDIHGVLLDISERHRLEEAQRQTLHHFDTVANASPVLFWTSGLNKGCDWFNDRWLEFTGRTLEQELGDGWTLGVHPDDFQHCLSVYVDSFDSRRPFSMEYRLRHNNGEYRWLLDKGLPRFDADGIFIGYIGSCLDITEEKIIQDTLNLSEERLRLALRAANQGIYDLNVQTGEAIVSPEYARMLGYDPDNFQETNAAWLTRLHPDDHALATETYQRYVKGELPEYRVEFRQRTFSGEWKWILSLGSIVERTKDNLPLRMLGTHTDIHARKLTEEALREQEVFFRLIAENISDFIAVIDLNGRRLYNSPSYQQFFGENKEISGSDSFAEIHPDDREHIKQLFQETVQTGIGHSAEYRLIASDGNIRQMESHGCVIFNDQNQPFRVIVISHDITERKQAEEAIRQLNVSLEKRVNERTAELQELNHSLESFVYSVSHDLKTPLRGIEGYGRLLQEDYQEKLDEEGRLFIANIRRGIKQMNDLIDDLLAYSRMERCILNTSAIDLNQLLDCVLTEHRSDIINGTVQIDVTMPPLIVHADPEGLALVLRNLLENALKFSSQELQPHIEIGAHQHNGIVTMWFKDNGIGFDMKYYERIFEIFHRLHRLEDYPGTGIGLALVKKAMQRMAGRIWAESQPGQGATFYLELKE